MHDVDEHAHCEMCGRVVEVGERMCDRKECLEKFEKLQSEKKRQVWMFIALIVAAVVLSKLLGG